MKSPVRRQIERLKSLDVKASRGPWIADIDEDGRRRRVICDDGDVAQTSALYCVADAELIAYSRTWLPTIINYIEILEQFIESLEDGALRRGVK